MKHIYLMATALAVSVSAFADTPVVERDFGDFAAAGCRNRDGDFMIRGLISTANEGTLVLADPTNSRSTASVRFRGRGPLARAEGALGTSQREAIDQQLSELRSSRTPVVITIRCEGDGTPLVLALSYVYLDGTHGAISL